MNTNALISLSMVNIANFCVLHASESLGKHDCGAGFDIPECMLQMIEHVSSACVIDVFHCPMRSVDSVLLRYKLSVDSVLWIYFKDQG